MLGVEQAFRQVREVIRAILRAAAIERTTRWNGPIWQRMAAIADCFRAELEPVDRRKRRRIVDRHRRPNKGIPMVQHLLTRSPPASHRTKAREKANKEADGVHRLRLFGGSAHAYGRSNWWRRWVLRDPGSAQRSNRRRRRTSVTGRNSFVASSTAKRDIFCGPESGVSTSASREVDTRRKPSAIRLIHAMRWASIPSKRINLLYLPRCALRWLHFGLDARVAACVGGGTRFPCGEVSLRRHMTLVRHHLTQILPGKIGNVIAHWRRQEDAAGFDGGQEKELATCALSWRRTSTACVTTTICV